MIERITVLGGSSVYIPEFLTSLLSHRMLIKELVLLGLPGEKLPIVADFCRRIIAKHGYETKVIAETDPVAAISGAQYIVNQVRVGGLKARMRDEKTPPLFDMFGSENLGAGGVINLIRTLPVVMDFAQIIEATNPKATLINLTNPVGPIVEALFQNTKLKVVGINALPAIYSRKIAGLLNCAVDDLEVDYVGIYDLGWIQNIKIDGSSRMKQVLERIEASNDDAFDHDIIRLFRMIPIREMSVYFRRHELLKEQQSGSHFRSDILYDAEKRILKMYRKQDLNTVPELTRQRNALWYDYTLIPLLQKLESNKSTTAILCVANNGAITDLPKNCSVEIPVRLTSKGIKARKIGMLPHFLRGIYCAMKESDRLAIKAVRHCSYENALQALVVNPFVPSLKKAQDFLDRCIRQEGFKFR
ncbi:MAG: hypothetical protein GX117_14770 [Candidatus Hydrogenedentes bacterium]|nr:hypothetical protein [Candidatus Hydrogenedentota bacterium]